MRVQPNIHAPSQPASRSSPGAPLWGSSGRSVDPCTSAVQGHARRVLVVIPQGPTLPQAAGILKQHCGSTSHCTQLGIGHVNTHRASFPASIEPVPSRQCGEDSRAVWGR